VPAIPFGTNSTLSELNLKDYEVLFFEPLHCCLNHIAHIIQELPHHITNVNILVILKHTITLSLNKDKLRCTDYRKALRIGNHMVSSAIWNTFERVGFQRVQNLSFLKTNEFKFIPNCTRKTI
jgi:hypothetical protein